ncbi:MAG: GTP-binding protein [Verrucomicrobia bacterium]|nr:GTP-binding protein [Verrucomicrobiota bacterium]
MSAHAPAASSTESLTPVTVFCGFLGAGKTTLLRHLLAQTPHAGPEGTPASWAAVVNDVAALNIDAATVRADLAATTDLPGATELVALGNGCVCCSGADDLGEAIARLARDGRFSHLWVETSGVADPRGIVNLFTRKNPFGKTLSAHARLAALVTVIDVVALATEADKATQRGRIPTAGGERPLFELMLEQIECADLVILNQCDRATEEGAHLSRARALVVGLNPRAEILTTEHGQVAAEIFLGRQRFDPRQTPASARWIQELNRLAGPVPLAALRPDPAPAYHELKYGISSMVYRARAPFDADKLGVLFATGLPGVIRAKGFFWTTRSPDEMGFISVAGGVVRWETLSVWWATRIAAGRARLEDRPASVIANWSEPHGDRRQEIVLIGTGIREREKELNAAIESCLTQ